MQGIKRSRLHGRAKENLLYLVFLLPAFALSSYGAQDAAITGQIRRLEFTP